MAAVAEGWLAGDTTLGHLGCRPHVCTLTYMYTEPRLLHADPLAPTTEPKSIPGIPTGQQNGAKPVSQPYVL